MKMSRSKLVQIQNLLLEIKRMSNSIHDKLTAKHLLNEIDALLKPFYESWQEEPLKELIDGANSENGLSINFNVLPTDSDKIKEAKNLFKELLQEEMPFNGGYKFALSKLGTNYPPELGEALIDLLVDSDLLDETR